MPLWSNQWTHNWVFPQFLTFGKRIYIISQFKSSQEQFNTCIKCTWTVYIGICFLWVQKGLLCYSDVESSLTNHHRLFMIILYTDFNIWLARLGWLALRLSSSSKCCTQNRLTWFLSKRSFSPLWEKYTFTDLMWDLLLETISHSSSSFQ